MKHYLPTSVFGLAFIIGATPVRLSSEIKNVPADYRTIQQAIDVAATGDTVLVAEGTYFENLQITSKSITLGSHFLIDGDTSHISRTVIDGSQPQNPDQASVIWVRWSAEPTVICGFRITGGLGTKALIAGETRVGGGINAVRSSITITDNQITNNSLIADDATGAGIQIRPWEYDSLSIIIRNNLIADNHAESKMTYGGGIGIIQAYQNNFNYLIENNIIRHNIVQNTTEWKAMGGGMALAFYLPTSCSQIIRNNLIIGNEAHCQSSFGGAMYILIQESISDGSVDNDAGPYIYNNIISDNHSDHLGGAVSVWRVYWPEGDVRAWALTSVGHYTPKPSFINNTFVNNSAWDGSAFYIMNHKPLLMNNILWDSLAENAVWGEIFLGNDSVWTSWVEGNTYGDAEVHYTDIQGGWNKGTGNINVDPAFLDTAYQLSDSSPCIGAGIDSTQIGGIWYHAPSFCFYGGPRPNPTETKPDMGACEHPQGTPTPVSVDESAPTTPLAFALEQNYPNPFNPATSIKYQIPNTSRVTLKVYDVLGKEVATLVAAMEEPGHKSVQWNASGMASGVYFYRLTAGDFVQTRKLLLLR
jgi:hypothetical protein